MRGTRFECEFLGRGRDWLDVRLELPFKDARAVVLQALERVARVNADTGEVVKPEFKEWQPLGRLGYKRGAELLTVPTSGTLRVMGEHPAAKSWSFLSGTQQCADFVWDVVDAVRPREDGVLTGIAPPQVNRVDIALDFRFPADRFAELAAHAHKLCEWHDIVSYQEGRPSYGETVWLGWSKTPEYRVSRNASLPIVAARLYQKGIEQGALIQADNPPDKDWHRFELVVRPDKPEGKEQAFRRSHDELLASREWARDFLDDLGYDPGTRAARLSSSATKVKLEDEQARKAKAMRTLGHMTDQYARAAQELAELVGRDRVIQAIEQALFTGRGEVDARNERVRPGDQLRREADALWVGRFEDEFRAGLRGGVQH